MDPFTENILERARERQKKLEGMKSPGKTPLRDTNVNTKSPGKTTSVSQPNLTETKRIPRKEVVSDSSVLCKATEFDAALKENQSEGNLSPFKRNSATRISSHLPGSPKPLFKTLNITKDDFNMEIKLMSSENVRVEVEIQDASSDEDVSAHDDKSNIRAQVKHKLQKLGRLYAGGEDADISSPITRTEGKFLAEDLNDVEQAQMNPEQAARHRKGLTKLADLAQNISNWEDDLSTHKRDNTKINATPKKSWKPPAPQPPAAQPLASNLPRKSPPGKSMKKTPAPKPPVSSSTKSVVNVLKKEKDQATPKQLKWDKTVLDTLESQGFTRTTSSSKLVYNYDSQGGKALASHEEEQEEEEEPREQSKESTALLKLSKQAGTPRSPVKARSTAIANKAALFESPSSSPSKSTKDPALMSVSERKALFEKNKGSALVPKAAFGMAAPKKAAIASKTKTNSVPNKYENNPAKPSVASPMKLKPQVGKTASSPSTVAISESGGIARKMAALLNKKSTIGQAQIETSVKEQRQKEMDVLLNRFNRNKEAVEEVESDGEDATDTTAMLGQKPPQVVAKVEVVAPPESKTPDRRKSGEKRAKKADSPLVQAALEDVKRIKVTQPKDGNLYPCLSDIEANTETEPEHEGTSNTSYDESTCGSDIGNTSFGRDVLQAVCRKITPQKRSIPQESDSDISDILDDMDEFLDDALDSESCEGTPGPTPPKHGKISAQGKQGPQTSESFHYKRFSPKNVAQAQETNFRSPAKVLTPRRSEDLPTHIVDGENIMPLTHTVSFYRKQTQVVKTPIRQISRGQPLIEETSETIPDESGVVQAKIQELTEEVNKQLTVISQASQALNLCNSTLEFSGSTEQVEAEKLLLLATHRRQAALHEIQRLEVEGTLRPQGNTYQNVQPEQGSLTIAKIMLPLKREYVRALAAAGGKGHHVMCLVKCGGQVIATQLVSTVASSSKNPDLELNVPGYVRLAKIYSDSAVTFEVYCLQAQQEILPHDVKYHINKKGSKSTPKKGKDTRMIRPPKESPAGPHAVRSPSFALMGYVVFSIQAMNRTQWTLNKTPSMSPLEGSVEMKVSCELDISVEHRGFLTMFEDVSGFGAWHRRWCLLKGHTLSYWKYPDEERKKAPIDSIDMKNCITKQVGPVSREICARLHTLLLERERWAQAGDKDSLTTICNGDKTIIRHLLSADTKEERIKWCDMVNKALVGLRMWKNE